MCIKALRTVAMQSELLDKYQLLLWYPVKKAAQFGNTHLPIVSGVVNKVVRKVGFRVRQTNCSDASSVRPYDLREVS